MVTKLKDSVNLIGNMGVRYLAFRVSHEIQRKTGMLRRKFPVNPPLKNFISLEQWKTQNVSFFFQGKDNVELKINRDVRLENWFEDYKKGKFTFFSSTVFDLGANFNWITNPDTGFVYDISKHWTEIADYSKEAGDIKYVWEKSRFSFLYNLIRYDHHFERDCSELVFKEINSWIDHNPINLGPNYRCSQEITLRVLNWTFALYYYKNSSALNDVLFQKIIHNIYWQIKHVYANINFSRIAVRNNHAITETMGLYLSGILFPFFPEAGKWKTKGKIWFEQEVAYQVYVDGTFLQFSMNYHRVVIQLLTWGISLSKINNHFLAPVVEQRAKASLDFLYNCMDLQSGTLPNYGANDGALFFPLNNNDYRDFRPQLHALSAALDMGAIESDNEDQYWFGMNKQPDSYLVQKQGMLYYDVGGYYLLREKDSFSFIRCGRHKDRPSQADNLHLDLWVKGKNILRDGGSFKYNADEEDLRYFFGTSSHNSVMLGDYDQMKKGGRFIWYYWTQAIQANWQEFENYFEFKGSVESFRHINAGILHTRTVRKYKSHYKWEVTDEINISTGLIINQLWHPSINGKEIVFKAFDENDHELTLIMKDGWHSPKYGIKEKEEIIVFSSTTNKIRTVIEILED